MTEKKQFYIPDHVDARFELIRNVKPRELLIPIPSLILSGLIWWLAPVSFQVKLSLTIFLVGVPVWAVISRPHKNNIPLIKHWFERFSFHTRQTEYFYAKEGIKYDVESLSEETGEETDSRTENAGASQENSATAHTDKGDSKRTDSHKRQQIS